MPTSDDSASSSESHTSPLPKAAESARRAAGLDALRVRDPKITRVIAAASFATVYVFKDKWNRADVEGTLFVVRRSVPPLYRLIILNQRAPKNLVEDVTKDWEISETKSYVFFRTPGDSASSTASVESLSRDHIEAAATAQTAAGPAGNNRLVALWVSDEKQRLEIFVALETALRRLQGTARTATSSSPETIKKKRRALAQSKPASNSPTLVPQANAAPPPAFLDWYLLKRQPSLSAAGNASNASAGTSKKKTTAQHPRKAGAASSGRQPHQSPVPPAAPARNTLADNDYSAGSTSQLNAAAAAASAAPPPHIEPHQPRRKQSPGAALRHVLGVVGRPSASTTRSIEANKSSSSARQRGPLQPPLQSQSSTVIDDLSRVLGRAMRSKTSGTVISNSRPSEATAVASSAGGRPYHRQQQHQLQQRPLARTYEEQVGENDNFHTEEDDDGVVDDDDDEDDDVEESGDDGQGDEEADEDDEDGGVVVAAYQPPQEYQKQQHGSSGAHPPELYTQSPRQHVQYPKVVVPPATDYPLRPFPPSTKHAEFVREYRNSLAERKHRQEMERSLLLNSNSDSSSMPPQIDHPQYSHLQQHFQPPPGSHRCSFFGGVSTSALPRIAQNSYYTEDTNNPPRNIVNNAGVTISGRGGQYHQQPLPRDERLRPPLTSNLAQPPPLPQQQPSQVYLDADIDAIVGRALRKALCRPEVLNAVRHCLAEEGYVIHPKSGFGAEASVESVSAPPHEMLPNLTPANLAQEEDDFWTGGNFSKSQQLQRQFSQQQQQLPHSQFPQPSPTIFTGGRLQRH